MSFLIGRSFSFESALRAAGIPVRENLEMATYARKGEEPGISEDMDLVYSLFPRLEERKKQRNELLSGGEQQMLAVGRALMTGASFIMLDEPSMGLEPLLMYDMFRALEFATRGYVLDTGEIIAEGSCAELVANPRVKKAYLGG